MIVRWMQLTETKGSGVLPPPIANRINSIMKPYQGNKLEYRNGTHIHRAVAIPVYFYISGVCHGDEKTDLDREKAFGYQGCKNKAVIAVPLCLWNDMAAGGGRNAYKRRSHRYQIS